MPHPYDECEFCELPEPGTKHEDGSVCDCCDYYHGQQSSLDKWETIVELVGNPDIHCLAELERQSADRGHFIFRACGLCDAWSDCNLCPLHDDDDITCCTQYDHFLSAAELTEDGPDEFEVYRDELINIAIELRERIANLTW